MRGEKNTLKLHQCPFRSLKESIDTDLHKMKGEGEGGSHQIIKEKIEIEEESIDPSSLRNWSDLTDAVLISIVDRLFPSLPDLFAFAGVCHSWRSAAATSSSAYRGPPLLVTPLPSPPLRWSGAARCRIRTLTGNNNDDGIRCVRSYKTLVSSQTPTTRCVGCSHSQLIFVLAGQKAALIDVFTGREIQSPNFPKTYKEFCIGILTAPLASSSCLLLLVAAHDTFLHYPTSVLCWRPGTSRWSELQTGKYLVDTIGSMVVFKGRVFALTRSVKLIVVEFVPFMSWKDLKIRIPASVYTCHGVSSHLVECGGDLLLVTTMEDRWTTRTPSVACIGVYRLDLSKAVWVNINSLGDWCLFVDAIRNHAVSCPSPTSWGGRNNCIYFAGPGYDTWIVVPLDGKPVEKPVESARFSRLEAFYFGHSNWSSPFWVYPRLGGIQMEARPALSGPSDDALLQHYLDTCTTHRQETKDEVSATDGQNTEDVAAE